MKKSMIKVLKVLGGFAIPMLMFFWFTFINYTSFFDFGRFESQCNFFLDNDSVVALGQRQLTDDRGIYSNVYDADSLEMKHSEALNYENFFLDCEGVQVLRQKERELLLLGGDFFGDDGVLHVYDIEESGMLKEMNDGKAFHLTLVTGLEKALWDAMGNAVFTSQEGKGILIGVIQDGAIHTIDLSLDEHFSTRIRAVYPGVATLMVYLENGEKWYVGQFLIDGKIPVVSEAERDALYAQYASLYFGGELIEKIAVNDEDLVDDNNQLEDPILYDGHEKLAPLGGLETWMGMGNPYGFGIYNEYTTTDNYYYKVLPYGYTIVSNNDSREGVPTTLLVDTFSGETRVDLSAFANEYINISKVSASAFASSFVESSNIVKNADGDDMLYVSNAYMNLTSGDSKVLTSDELNSMEEKRGNSLEGYFRDFIPNLISMWDITSPYGIFVAFLVLLPFILFIIGWLRNHKTKKTMKKVGIQTIYASVMEIQRINTIKDEQAYLLKLRFIWEGNMLVKQVYKSEAEALKLRIGDQILVVYDPIKDTIQAE